jgi:hypothetical protein
MDEAVSALLVRPACFRAGGKPMVGELAPGMGATVGNRPAGLPALPGSGSAGRGGIDPGGRPTPWPPAPGGLAVPVGDSAVTAREPVALPDSAFFPVAVAVSLTSSALVAAGSTAETAWSSSDWLAGSVPRAQDAPLACGQTVNFGAPMFLAAATLAVTVTEVLAPPALQTQTTKPAVCPAWTVAEPDSDWTWTQSFGSPGEADGLGLVLFDGLGLGLGDEPEGVGVGVLIGLGLGGGALVVGGGAWLCGTVAVGEAIGPSDFGGEGTVLSEIVGVGSGAALPDGAVADTEGLTAAARTAACGRLAQDGAAGVARDAPNTLELIVSRRKPAMPPTAAGRTTDDAFTSTPSPSWLRGPQDWCSPCPSQLCPSK